MDGVHAGNECREVAVPAADGQVDGRARRERLDEGDRVQGHEQVADPLQPEQQNAAGSCRWARASPAERTESEGRILVLFDVSLSMEATDVSPTRLDAAKEAASAFVSQVDPEVEVASLMYHGATRLRMDPADARAQELFQAARGKLEDMRRGGWDTMNLNVIAAALEFMSGNDTSGWSMVQAMQERGWQPYGVMRSSPLFDTVLNVEPLPARWATLDRDFQAMQQRCGAINLAKLGL